MNVFISWSQTRSRKFADAFKEFLECVIQEVKPFVSTGDIQSGEQWFTKIMQNLSQSSQGIICITPENKENRWIMFESGAIAKGIEGARVHTVLIGVKPEEISPPLSQFNMVLADQDGVKKLVRSINETLLAPLSEKTLERAFDAQWPILWTKIQQIEAEEISTITSQRTTNDIMLEILNTVRSLDNRVRDLETSKSQSALLDLFQNEDSTSKTMVYNMLRDNFEKKNIDPKSKFAITSMMSMGFTAKDIASFYTFLDLLARATEDNSGEK